MLIFDIYNFNLNYPWVMTPLSIFSREIILLVEIQVVFILNLVLAFVKNGYVLNKK
jgi:hypothetical protein